MSFRVTQKGRGGGAGGWLGGQVGGSVVGPVVVFFESGIRDMGPNVPAIFLMSFFAKKKCVRTMLVWSIRR